MTTLHQAYVAADQAYYAAYERLQEETDEALLGQLQAAFDEALEHVDAAKKALIESDDPRPWTFEDEEEGHFLTVTLRPSEVEERLRAAVRGNFEDCGDQVIRVQGYAHCADTNQSYTVEVIVEPPPLEADSLES
jgi:hypothetical protein